MELKKRKKMAVAANVRLVRCPKCENLLPELPDFSLYQCGGCGAVLKGTTHYVRFSVGILCLFVKKECAFYQGTIN